MKRILHIVAQSVSIVCYPLLIPAYGILLWCIAMHHRMALPEAYWWVSIGGTLFLTCLLPLSLILMMIRRGQVDNLYIDNPRQRTTPYLYSIAGFGFWCYLLASILHVPGWLTGSAIGATLALGIVTLINLHWKISAHLAAMGGLLGGICTYALKAGLTSLTPIYILLTLSLLLMWARLYVDAHNSWQVVAGYGLGFISTLIPAFFVYA